jgi:L-alanine-DL-glutamate epimerase-like enolase superfamily enzyme
LSSASRGPVSISQSVEHWPFKHPFRITGHTFDGIDVLVVTVERGGLIGRGEAAGVYYRGETAELIATQVEAFAANTSLTHRDELLTSMPPGGARNALDCALWDLEAKEAKRSVSELAGLGPPRPLLTTLTLSAEAPEAMAQAACALADARALKLKLLGDAADVERVNAVRAARPDVWIGVDANQGFTPRSYHDLIGTLVAADVQLIEQPFAVGLEHQLIGLDSPIPIAADESVQDHHDLERVGEGVQVVNIKLDKCGGLTEALRMAANARQLGLRVMVGNMVGTSLSIAPAFVLGQLCDLVDLDGPVFLARDRDPTVSYTAGLVSCPPELWGGGVR